MHMPLRLVLAATLPLVLATPSLSFQDHDGYPGLDKEELQEVVHEAEEAAGRPKGSTYYTVDGPLLHRFPAATNCHAEPRSSPNAGRHRVSLNPEKMKEVYEVAGEGFDGLLEGDARGELIGTVVHELVHVCLHEDGVPCISQANNGQSDKFNEDCAELLVDATAHKKLCKAIAAKCNKVCALIAAASTPPTPEQQEAIDKLKREIQGLCKAAKVIEDKYNTEVGAETACACQSIEPPYPPNTPECDAQWPPPPPNDPPHNEDDPCDYPEGEEQPVIPPCEHCPCNCADLEADDD